MIPADEVPRGTRYGRQIEDYRIQPGVFLAERNRVQAVSPAQVKHTAGSRKFRNRCHGCSHLLEEPAPAVLRHGGDDHLPEHLRTVAGDRTVFCNTGKVRPEAHQFFLEGNGMLLRKRGIPDKTGLCYLAVTEFIPYLFQQAKLDQPLAQEGDDLRSASQFKGTFRPGLWLTKNFEQPEIKGRYHRMVLPYSRKRIVEKGERIDRG